MKNGGLKAEMVAKELSSSDPALKEAAWSVAGRHPEWGGQLAGFLRERLAAKELKPPSAPRAGGAARRTFSGTLAVQEMLTEKVRDARADREARRLSLQAMAAADLKEAPPWIDALARKPSPMETRNEYGDGRHGATPLRYPKAEDRQAGRRPAASRRRREGKGRGPPGHSRRAFPEAPRQGRARTLSRS